MSVRKKITIQQHMITVSLSDGVVHIISDDELKSLLNKDLFAGTRQVIGEIKKEYVKAFDKTLQISDQSLEAELWGHLYSEFFFHDIYRLLPLKPMGKLYRFVKFHCTVIDSGERGRDSNRGFWNILAVGRKLIALLLKRRLRRHCALLKKSD